MERPKYDIFISHSSKDKSFTDNLLLGKAGFDIWYDESTLLPSTLINRERSTYIKQCESVLVVLSKDSCCSQWVAGIVRGAGTDLFLVAKQPRQAPPFMFKDTNTTIIKTIASC